MKKALTECCGAPPNLDYPTRDWNPPLYVCSRCGKLAHLLSDLPDPPKEAPK